MAITKDEAETHISFLEAEDTANLYTCRPALMRRMEKLGVKPYREDVNEGKVIARTYEIPKKWVKISPPRKSSMTEEQKRAGVERLAAARIKNKGVSVHDSPGVEQIE